MSPSTFLSHQFIHFIRNREYPDKGLWGNEKRCKKGDHVVGAEVGLHDDYGLSNFEKEWRYWRLSSDYWTVYFYLSSIVNIRLYCSGYGNDGTTMIEGHLSDGPFHHKWKEQEKMYREVHSSKRYITKL